MKKGFKWFLVLVTILSLLVPLATLAIEDLTTFTEVDAGDDITVTASTVTMTALPANVVSYVYKDYGVDNFEGDYYVTWESNIDSMYNASSGLNMWSVFTNDVGNASSWYSDAKDFLGVWLVYSGTRKMNIVEGVAGSIYSSGYIDIAEDTTYYWTFAIIDGTAYLWQYSDSARTNQTGEVTLVLHDIGEAYRYFFALASKSSGSVNDVTTGYLKDFTLGVPIYQNEIETQGYEAVWNSEALSWDVTLSANLTDDGGELNTCYFYYKLASEGSYTYWQQAGDTVSWETGDNVTTTLTGISSNQTYTYIATAYNSGFSDNGSEETFVIGLPDNAPSVNFVYDGLEPVYTVNSENATDNATITLTGHVIYDGNYEVTAWFDYKAPSLFDWMASSDNETGLYTSDNFTITITDLIVGQTYYFRAHGQNEIGDSYGATWIYTWTETRTPVITTLPATNITNHSATLNAYLNDAGESGTYTSGNAQVNFQYHIVGYTSWQTTPLVSYTTGDNISQDITGLLTNQIYEFRAVARVYDYNFNALIGYGDNLTIAIYQTIQKPIMSTENITFISSNTWQLYGKVLHDGGSPVTVWFDMRKVGALLWDSSTVTYGANSGDGFYQYVYNLLPNTSYEFKAVGQNGEGIGEGQIITYTTNPTGTGGGTGGTGGGTTVPNWIDGIARSQGVTDVMMGRWLVLIEILIIVSLLFVFLFVRDDDSGYRKIISIIWLMVMVAIIGGFIFTGVLGIVPILVLAGATILLILLVGGKLIHSTVRGD